MLFGGLLPVVFYRGFCACEWSTKVPARVSLSRVSLSYTRPETPPLDSFVYIRNMVTHGDVTFEFPRGRTPVSS